MSIELSDSKLISTCRNIVSGEVGQKAAHSGPRSRWEAGSGDSAVSFFPSAGSEKKERARGG